jgi:hypothetical protein
MKNATETPSESAFTIRIVSMSTVNVSLVPNKLTERSTEVRNKKEQAEVRSVFE